MSYLPPADDNNPFRAPAARVGENAVFLDEIDRGGEAEAIRREHINHEASIRSLGALYYLGAFFGGLGTLFMLLMGAGVIPIPQNQNDPNVSPRMMQGIFLGIGVFYLAMTALNVFLGYGLRKLQVWARWTVIVLTGLGLLYLLFVGAVSAFANPIVGVIILVIGGLIPGYILYLMVSPKASVVFSAEYKEIILKTPHVKPKTSLILKIFLVLLVLLIVIAVVAALSSRG